MKHPMKSWPLLVAGLAAGLALAACSPTTSAPTGPSVEAPTGSASASACAARGGEMRQEGRMQSWQCVTLYADAGKVCRDGSDCAGDCLAAGDVRPEEGAAATGICAADSSRFGCRTTITDGKAAPTLCID